MSGYSLAFSVSRSSTSSCDSPARGAGGGRLHARGLDGRSAESGDNPARDVLRQIVGQRDRPRVVNQES